MKIKDKLKGIVRIDRKAVRQFFTYINVIGMIVLVIGLILLFYAFDSSMSLLIGVILITETWFIHVFYLVMLACIGGFLVRQAVKVLGTSRALATLFLILGFIFLLQIFWAARVFVETSYQLTLFVVFGMFFFIIMVAIFLYMTMQGLSFFITSQKGKKPDIKPTPVPEKEGVNQAPEVLQEPLATTEPVTWICPRCLSKLSPEDTHCIYCGLLLPRD